MTRTTPQLPQTTQPPQPDQPTLFEQPMTMELKYVATASIEPPETRGQIRSVTKFGMLQTVLLRPSDNPAYLYTVVAGSRRVNTAIEHGLLTVPAMITDGTAGQIAAARAIENTARRDNPVQEALAWREVLDTGVYADVKALASDLGVPLRVVKKRLQLAKLPPRILQGVNDGVISEHTAARMSTLDANYLGLAFAAFDAAVAKDERFSNDDLRAVQVRRTQATQAAVSGALRRLPGAQALLTLDPAAVLAEQVRQMCAARGIDPLVLARHLSNGSTPAQASQGPASQGQGAQATASGTPVTQAPITQSPVSLALEDEIPFDRVDDLEADADGELEGEMDALPFADPAGQAQGGWSFETAAADDLPFGESAGHALPSADPGPAVPVLDALPFGAGPVEEEADWTFEPQGGADDVQACALAAVDEEDLVMPWDVTPPPVAPRSPAQASGQGSARAAGAGTGAPRAPRAAAVQGGRR